jgi:methenyltetrahydromethanopterin cyclohydrolase
MLVDVKLYKGYDLSKFFRADMGIISVNKLALNLVKELMDNQEYYQVKVLSGPLGSSIIDAGIEARGGFEAGRIITEICMGGLGKASLSFEYFDGKILPAIRVYTDHPIVATMASQYAGWRIKVGKFFALGSGPARALSLEPKMLYEKIGYRDESDEAVIVFETSSKPDEAVVEYIANKCGVKPSNLYIILTPTTSLSALVQIAGRIVETGIHKLNEIGFDINRIVYGCGYAPIAFPHPDFGRSMGRSNDVILYGGVAFYGVDFEDDEALDKFISETPSSASKDYGRPFHQIFKEAGYDFYKIDPHLFAPASVIAFNVRTGKVHKAGRVDVEILLRSLGIS